MSPQFIKDKSREISYALIRVSFYIKRADLRSRLEKLAFELLENSARAAANNSLENLNQALASVSVLDGLIRLAYSIYEIEPVNANILVKELEALNTAIRQYGNLDEELPDIGNFFSDNPAEPSSRVEDLDSERGANDPGSDLIEGGNKKRERLVNLNDLEGDLEEIVSDSANQEVVNRQTSGKSQKGSGNGFNTAIRQAEIINKIKSGNFSGNSESASIRLKDLVAEFPDVSERTLRYDLQKLCDQGVIERVGNGGPSSYYILKEGGGEGVSRENISSMSR